MKPTPTLFSRSLRLFTWACLLWPFTGAQAVDLKIATLAPDGTAWMLEMRQGAAQIAERTQGRVNFKFYPGGAMGNDKSILRKIRAGQLHGGAITGGGLVDVYPDIQIYSLPFLFRSLDEMDYVRSRMDKMLSKGLEDNGFVNFGIAEGGFAYLMSQQPMRERADLKREKIWVPEGDIISRTVFEDLGVSPIPLPLTDVLTGLQTGLISTIGASPSGAIALQWHTKVKYMTDVPLIYIYGMLVVDRRAFTRISSADQVIVREVMGKTFSRLNEQNRRDNESARTALRNQGIEIVDFSPKEVGHIRDIANQASDRLGEKNVFRPTTLKALRAHLQAYRSKKPPSPIKH